jgi:hypothetical protein
MLRLRQQGHRESIKAGTILGRKLSQHVHEGHGFNDGGRGDRH